MAPIDSTALALGAVLGAGVVGGLMGRRGSRAPAELGEAWTGPPVHWVVYRVWAFTPYREITQSAADILDELQHPTKGLTNTSWLPHIDEAMETRDHTGDGYLSSGVVGIGLRLERWMQVHPRKHRVTVPRSKGQPILTRAPNHHSLSIAIDRSPGAPPFAEWRTSEPSPYFLASVDWMEDRHRDERPCTIYGVVVSVQHTFDALKPTTADLEWIGRHTPHALDERVLLGGRPGYLFPVHPPRRIPAHLSDSIHAQRQADRRGE